MPALTLHLPTLFAMTVIAALVMAGALAAVSTDRRREGLEMWAAALLMQALAYVLLSLRGQIPDLISVVLANVLLSGVFACTLAAVFRFQGVPLRWPPLVGPVAVTLLLFVLFIDNYPVRLVLAGVIFPVQLGLTVWALCRPNHPSAGRGAALVVVGLSFQALVLVVRAGYVLADAMPLDGLMQVSGVQLMSFLATFFTVQLASFGFIFMTKDRADAANRRMAALDPLTGVPNRRSTIAALDRDLARAVRTRESLSLMMLDIDHFKRINDELGHLVGDKVLCGVVEVLGRRIRSQDMIGRYGGEEFLIVLPDTPLVGAQQLARTLCEAVAQTRFEVAGRQVKVTISIGVFGGRLESGDTWDMLIAAADRAMYRAKNGGRNRVEVAADLRREVAPRTAVQDNPETYPASLPPE